MAREQFPDHGGDAPLFLCSERSEGFILPVFKQNMGLMHISPSLRQRSCVLRASQVTPGRQVGAALVVLTALPMVAQVEGPNKGMELTAYSVRSYLAPAFGSSSCLAFGSVFDARGTRNEHCCVDCFNKEGTAVPYVTNQNVRIHYQIEGELGPPLVLQHGFSNSLETWYYAGYVQALQHDYQLILIDARGHGASDKPHDPEAYVLQSRAGDIVAVLDHLHITHAYFFGYSMGGWIGFGLAQYAPERFHALIIGGSHPYARSMDPQRQILRKALEQGKEAFVAGVEEQ